MKTTSPVTIPIKNMKPPHASTLTSLVDVNSNPMKTPIVSSVPHLLDINPNAPFEFHFPADEPWWDQYDFDNDPTPTTSAAIPSPSAASKVSSNLVKI